MGTADPPVSFSDPDWRFSVSLWADGCKQAWLRLHPSPAESVQVKKKKRESSSTFSVFADLKETDLPV